MTAAYSKKGKGGYGAEYGARRSISPPKGSVWKQKSGGYWYALRIDGERKNFPLVPPGRKKATKTKGVAQELAWRIYNEQVREVYGANEIEGLLKRHLRDRAQQVAPRYLRQKECALLDFFASRNIVHPLNITRAEVLDYLASLALAPKSVNNRLAYISGFCERLIDEGVLGANPCRRIAGAKVPEREIVYLSRAEAGRALRAARKAGLVLEVATALYAGLRLDELRELRWGDLREGPNGPILVVRTPKGGKPQSVPVCRKLRRLFGEVSGEGYVFRRGTRRTWSRRLVPIKAAVPKMARAGGGWHDFRRTLGSLLVQKGVSLFAVSKLLRHRSITTTQKHYAHLAAEHGREALELL